MATGEKIIPRLIEDEMRSSYLDYSMSVIVSRALPDVRDGLKPVHRRILYGMRGLGLVYNRPYKKSARIVGEVLGKYHPHGDAAVYETMVRMIQDFSLRYPLIDGQGNFGSIDGDSPAAMRYTEARMARISEELLKDIDKDTVDFAPNFDDTLEEPKILPAVLPNLLINGASGIAVGMATNIPPHNIREVITSIQALIDNPEIELESLLKYVTGPDFPTAGIILGYQGIKDAYLTGRGRVLVRARANIEVDSRDRERIIITEIPYQVNKTNLIEKMVDLVQTKKIEGISDIRDESDRDGLRVVIELKRDANAISILNSLYKHSQMQTTFGVIMLALVNGEPKVLNLKEILQHFINHRHVIVVRRTKYELDEAEKRAHILEGLKIAIDNIDEIIELIKKSKDPENAKSNLIRRFKFSEIQAKAILEMRLQRLTGLERQKIEEEYKEVLKLIEKLKAILDNRGLRMQIIKDELAEIEKTYGDERRTEIVANYEELTIEDMIAEEDMVITISHRGNIKRFPVSGYRRQNRGGRGSKGAGTREEDFLEHMFIASTHHYILFFTEQGRCYWLKVHEIPQAGKASRGRPIINLIDIQKGESIRGFVTVKKFDDDGYIIVSTKSGIVKKTALSAFSRPRRGGIVAVTIREKDELLTASLSSGNNDIILVTKNGYSIRFNEKEVREMGRSASGVKGVTLRGNDEVIGMVVVKREDTLLTIAEKGLGKRSNVSDYRTQSRGGKGIIAMKVTEKTGCLVAVLEVVDNEDIIIITENGVVIRQHIGKISVIGRNTQGVRLIRLDEHDKIGDVAKIVLGSEENGIENGIEEDEEE
ncbi:MAG: DNA gyrase subunit A [Calditrichales bacterium]|nr:MAG: DNA gyrase subunit A [Calditrichales bacterium]